MDIKETFAFITEKSTEAEAQHAELLHRLEENQKSKKQAEADKEAALDAKNEESYKIASREIADAQAGIDFCEVCLQSLRHKKFATEAESATVLQGLQAETNSTYVDAILKIETSLAAIVETMDAAKQKFSAINQMARIWNEHVMKDYSPADGLFCADKEISLATFDGQIKGKLTILREGKRNNPLFSKGAS